MTRPQVKVLVVDDSPVARELLVHILSSDPGIKVVATASCGSEAIDALETHRPDIVTMDVHMPGGLDGFETTRRIMETQPVPVVIVSGAVDPKESAVAFRALDAGALAILERPVGMLHPSHATEARKLVQTVKAMSEVRVIRRWGKPRPSEPAPAAPAVASLPHGAVRIVAIGVSTGGPPVLHTILAALPKPFPVPILIVQHISAGFLEGLTNWLTTTTGVPVHIARNDEVVLPGCAYLAPDGHHMGVDRHGTIVLSDEPPDHGLRPSVAHLFRSVASAYGRSAVGILLTGMGRDGADELKQMRMKGALTVAQDKESSVVHGMPGEAIKIDAAVHVLPPERIASTLGGIVK